MADFYIDVIQVGVSCLLLILIGYLLSFFKVFSPSEFGTLNKFSAKICFPFLLFRSMASRKIREISFDPLVNALLMSSSSQILLALTFAFPFKDRLYMYLSTTISSCYINYIIIGIPIFSSIWGNGYNHVPAVCSFNHYILLVPLFMIWSQLWKIIQTKKEIREAQEREAAQAENATPLATEAPNNTGEENRGDEVETTNEGPESHPGEESSQPVGKETEPKLSITFLDVLKAFWTALKTPLVVGNLVGLIWSAIGIDYPLFFEQLGTHLGNCVVVFALIGIGHFLHAKSIISCHPLQLAVCLAVRFFVCPGFSLFWALALKVPNRTSRQCVVLSMLPAANAGFILASSVGIGANTASAMVFWSLIFIVPVLILWFYIFDHFGIFPDDTSDIIK